jgi:hypothetical protein
MKLGSSLKSVAEKSKKKDAYSNGRRTVEKRSEDMDGYSYSRKNVKKNRKDGSLKKKKRRKKSSSDYLGEEKFKVTDKYDKSGKLKSSRAKHSEKEEDGTVTKSKYKIKGGVTKQKTVTRKKGEKRKVGKHKYGAPIDKYITVVEK